MIIRRITSAFKRQDWFTVFIETLIVVLGVFLGLQASNWNDARKTHERSRTYTERLQNDLHVEYEYAVALRQYFLHAHDDGEIAFNGLSRKKDIDDRTILINAYRGRQTQWYERRRAAFDELVASGDLELITDTTLRQTAASFYSNSEIVYEIVRSHAQDSEYGKLFDQLIDPDVRMSLDKDCGDREYVSPDGVPGILTIAYDCKLASVDDMAVKKAVAALRAEPRLLPALRRDIVTHNVDVININYMLENTGIGALFDNRANT